ncbi:MAG: type I DNA topoisomerase [Elusimicrobiaceae bacterium]|nr:type I DNA topoisomerase [Elusimicrobiaceae bacterium]
MAAKGKKLVIVESPTKQKTISKILGSDFIVRSSFGHVRDLPQHDMGVDIEHGFTPTYEPVERAKKILKELTTLAKAAPEIYLATDPDREGEAIAWHLIELLKLPKERYQRIFFHEITPTAIKESFSHARKIDENLVNAQQARRVLDRIVGYKLSPLLWKKITRGLSAGRVQSVAVRLLAERAKEIADFKEQPYWTMQAQFEKPGTAPAFWARVTKYQGKNVEQTKTYKLFAEDYKVKNTVFDAPEKLAPVSDLLRKGPNTVLKVEKKEVKQHPKPPFITSTLQQDAYNKLGFSSQKTMQTAQHLYEGIEVEGQTVGLITYMRTDSFNVSKLLQEQTKKFIGQKYGEQFVPAKPNIFKSKVMGAQEAHEAIHPTDVRRTPQNLKPFLTADQYKLYELIWLRFVASQMADAVFNTVSIDIAAKSEKDCVLRATGRTVKFPGYLSIYKDEDETQNEEDNSALLPMLAEGDELKLVEIKTKDHKTTPPPYYNEASLIKTLEKHGIGRPSTYAPTIKTIIDRKYIARQPKSNKLVATDLGITVTDSLKGFFKEIMDLSYTAGVEEKLDKIAEGDQKWVELMASFYQNFAKDLDAADKGMQRPAAKETDEKCPICGKMMLKKRSRFGEYLVCSDDTCKGKINLTSTGEKVQPEKTNEVCDKCGKPMVIRMGRRGKFLACSGYPACKNTFSLDAQGNKVASTGPIVTDRLCEKCGKPMVLRTSKRGEFLGCSGYPKCKTIVTVTPDEIAQIKAAHAQKQAQTK